VTYQEIEIKYRLGGPDDHERLRVALKALGAEASPMRIEENVLFDTATRELRGRGNTFRLRVIDGGPGGVLTLKGRASFEGGVKSRQELEVGVADAATMREMLTALGYRPTVGYTTRREIWRVEQVEVALDALEFGHFCELEGPRDAILALSRQLQLDPVLAERATYPALAMRHQAGQTL
jgi:predicted adenylyl cyclase CyaB